MAGHNRVQAFGSTGRRLPNRKTELEQARIRQEGKRSEEVRRATTAEQTAIQEQRLSELGGVLAQQRASEFGQFIPEEAKRSQVSGLLETSGFREALTREAGRLGTRSAFELSRQALSDRDLEIAGIGEAGEINRAFGTAGLERRFSLADQQASERLSRELGRLGVANTAQRPSGGSNFLQGAVAGAGVGFQIGGPVGAGVGAVAGGVISGK